MSCAAWVTMGLICGHSVPVALRAAHRALTCVVACTLPLPPCLGTALRKNRPLVPRSNSRTTSFYHGIGFFMVKISLLSHTYLYIPMPPDTPVRYACDSSGLRAAPPPPPPPAKLPIPPPQPSRRPPPLQVLTDSWRRCRIRTSCSCPPGVVPPPPPVTSRLPCTQPPYATASWTAIGACPPPPPQLTLHQKHRKYEAPKKTFL